MKGYMVLLLVCLASLQLIDAGRRGSSGGSRSSSSSGGGRSSYSSSGRSSSSSSYGRSSSSSSSGRSSPSGSSGRSYSSSSGGRGSTQNRGRVSTSQNIHSNTGTSGGSRSGSRSATRAYQPPNNYGSSYGGYGSSSLKGGKGYSYKSKGYGTRFGTNFKNQGKHTGYSKKALGMGVAAGFVGGAAVGGVATYGVYHRYNKYRDLMYRRKYDSYGGDFHDDWGWGSYGYSPDYYNNYYRNNRCRYPCPYPAVCRYGFCECDYGYTRRYGRCRSDWNTYQYTPKIDFDPLSQACVSNEACFEYDFNLICNKELTTTAGRCQCRTDMKWNAEAYECQLYLDVDCSKITYDTKVSTVVEKAVEKAEKRLENVPENEDTVNLLVAGDETDPKLINETVKMKLNDEIKIENVLKTSLLDDMDIKTASENDILEAYCRDVDALSHEFQKGGTYGHNNRNRRGMGVGSIVGIVIFVLLSISCCCLCAVCCACKGVLSCCKKKDRAPSPVAFSAVQNQEEMHTSPVDAGFTPPGAGYPSATQAYQPPNQPGYAPIYPPVNQ